MNGTLSVARYSLLELTRRRIPLVFAAVGVVGIGGLGLALKLFSGAFLSSASFSGPDGSGPTSAQLQRLTELGFVQALIGVLDIFALLIAFAIGMTVIYHDLESGSAVGIFSKPISRFAFATGKVLAAIVAMLAVVGLLSIEARFVMFLFGGGLEAALWFETLAGVANAVTLMMVVLALTAWVNNIVAGIAAFIYNGASGIVVALHQQLNSSNQGGLDVLKGIINVVYWLVPHQLTSSAARDIARAQFEIYTTGQPDAPPVDQIVSGIPGASGTGDIVWWVFVVVVLCGLLYLAVRRRQV